ncbi:DUF4317 domain-containing protein [Clostridium thermarum]|uniref:DUF4317 domain-containing protein n=1 Tax=Clostridium thermarum TaxID=1716543 RepID=UPI001121A852|nr:DUF4317 domain-containing protein [Clostridium thermarum]
MIKKDLADMRKHMKPESTMLQFGEIYNIYLKKDNLEIIHKEVKHFNALDEETQELYIKNFKKLLSGALDTKLFELDFKDVEIENHSQGLLYSALESKSKEEELLYLDEIVNKLAANYKYDSDIVITFVRGQYWKGAKKRSIEADEAVDDNVFAFNFFIGSINKIEYPKKALQFDYINREFRTNSTLDAVINLKSPLDGFMFPCFNNNCTDVNHILYYTGRTNEVNMDFIEEVLNCSLKITAAEEKSSFNAIIKEVVGDAIAPETMQSIYEKIASKAEQVEEGEVPLVTIKDVQNVLEYSGIEEKDIEKLEKVYEETIGSTSFDFKIDNILPDLKSKSVKIESETANISIAPNALSKIKQVRDKHGRKCLLIELNEDIEINGIKIKVTDF